MNKVLIYFILLFFINFSSCKKCVDVDVPYTEEEPYTTIENTNITLSYSIEENVMHYRRNDGTLLFGDNPTMDVYTTVTNTSEYGGEFTFYAYLTSQNDKIEFRTKKYIPAGTQDIILVTKEINPYTFKANVEVDKWDVNAPTISIDKEVTKFRAITKYRKCNTCVEDCGDYYKTKGTPWYVYLFVILGLIGIITWLTD